MFPERFSQAGSSTSRGGLRGWNDVWQNAQLIPTRNGRMSSGLL